MIIGKKSIEEFVINAGMNPDVFEAMTRLMFYYSDFYLEMYFNQFFP